EGRKAFRFRDKLRSKRSKIRARNFPVRQRSFRPPRAETSKPFPKTPRAARSIFAKSRSKYCTEDWQLTSSILDFGFWILDFCLCSENRLLVRLFPSNGSYRERRIFHAEAELDLCRARSQLCLR